jgi:hypothetical protein
MKNAIPSRSQWPLAAAAAVGLLATATGCDDNPFAFNWDPTPDTVLLYSLQRPELNLVSGFNFFQGVAVSVEDPDATGQWDAALDTRSGQLVFVLPGAFGISTTARIATLDGMQFDDVTEAPADTLVYEGIEPVPVRTGTIYVVKTNRIPGSFGSTCVYYAKAEALDIDVAQGTLLFRYVTNPVCNSQDLVPPD